MFGPTNASLTGCVGWAPPTLTELEAPLLALFRSVQKLLGHGLSCRALPCGSAVCCVVVQRQKLSKGEAGSPVHACQPWYRLAVPY